jgi:hypothetical protein
MVFRYINEPKNFLLEPARISYATLRNTLMHNDADRSKEPKEEDDQIDVYKVLDGVDMTHRETQALKRSNRIRKCCDAIPENSIKMRKAYFCNSKDGYLNKEPGTASQANMMTDPNMMNNMLKQNMQGVVHMVMFSTIGSIFAGFIIA